VYVLRGKEVLDEYFSSVVVISRVILDLELIGYQGFVLYLRLSRLFFRTSGIS
jgi:hypothetical protein